MHRVYLGLGSNIEPRKEHLEEAFRLLSESHGVINFRVSPLYETKPVGYLDQADFMNAVVVFDTDLGPYDVLGLCQEVESTLKRVRKIRWGPRTIDVDVLLYGNLELIDEDLTIPHPRMHERAFVLEPLIALEAEVVFSGKTAEEWLKNII